MRLFLFLIVVLTGCPEASTDDRSSDASLDVGIMADGALPGDEGSPPNDTGAPRDLPATRDVGLDQAFGPDASADMDAPDMDCATDEDCLRQLPGCDLADVERDPGGDGWKDSYSVGDKCYCDTTFDHDIGDVIVDTPVGPKTVREVCEALGPGPGSEGHPIFNDIQCGNGPANDAGDEDWCPGRVDEGRDGCCTVGPRWDFDDAEW